MSFKNPSLKQRLVLSEFISRHVLLLAVRPCQTSQPLQVLNSTPFLLANAAPIHSKPFSAKSSLLAGGFPFGAAWHLDVILWITPYYCGMRCAVTVSLGGCEDTFNQVCPNLFLLLGQNHVCFSRLLHFPFGLFPLNECVFPTATCVPAIIDTLFGISRILRTASPSLFQYFLEDLILVPGLFRAL